MSVTQFFVRSHHVQSMLKEKLFFSTCLSKLINIKSKQTQKIVGERISTFCVLLYRHDNFYCALMVIFTFCTIFFGVLRKCYKITVPHSSFYLELPCSFWQTFFSVYASTPSMHFISICEWIFSSGPSVFVQPYKKQDLCIFFRQKNCQKTAAILKKSIFFKTAKYFIIWISIEKKNGYLSSLNHFACKMTSSRKVDCLSVPIHRHFNNCEYKKKYFYSLICVQ